MHAGDAGADDAAADRAAPLSLDIDGRAQAEAGDEHGQEQRERRQLEVVRNCNAGVIRQHRDKMRAPDAATRGRPSGDDPTPSRAAGQTARATKQIDSGVARQGTDPSGDDDKPQVMFGNKASDDAKHEVRPGADKDAYR